MGQKIENYPEIPLYCPECCRIIDVENIYYNKNNIVVSCHCGWDMEIKI